MCCFGPVLPPKSPNCGPIVAYLALYEGYLAGNRAYRALGYEFGGLILALCFPDILYIIYRPCPDNVEHTCGTHKNRPYCEGAETRTRSYINNYVFKVIYVSTTTVRHVFVSLEHMF